MRYIVYQGKLWSLADYCKLRGLSESEVRKDNTLFWVDAFDANPAYIGVIPRVRAGTYLRDGDDSVFISDFAKERRLSLDEVYKLIHEGEISRDLSGDQRLARVGPLMLPRVVARWLVGDLTLPAEEQVARLYVAVTDIRRQLLRWKMALNRWERT